MTTLTDIQSAIQSANAPLLVEKLVHYALQERASDIHIEPLKNTSIIRLRVDGSLKKIAEFAPSLHPAVVSRVKILSKLKIDETRMPQDGRASMASEQGKPVDLRVSTLPTIHLEKVVMRLQDQSREIPSFEELGLEGTTLHWMNKALEQSNGIILTTGPTGSGKTTTLYSALKLLNQNDVNILTIEDPVEIQMDGLNQSQVHHDIDYTFANGLRTALRQDPDIIMVGEIRDRETVDVAIEASLTGHLVLSTLHTNSAVETLTRLLNMGVPNYLITASVRLILAQRLIRKLCEHCKQVHPLEADIWALVQKALAKLPAGSYDLKEFEGKSFYKASPQGCTHCQGTGYLGRVGIYEVLVMTRELKSAILSGKSSLELEDIAQNKGMITLEQAGILKAWRGESSLEEVYSITSGEDF